MHSSPLCCGPAAPPGEGRGGGESWDGAARLQGPDAWRRETEGEMARDSPSTPGGRRKAEVRGAPEGLQHRWSLTHALVQPSLQELYAGFLGVTHFFTHLLTVPHGPPCDP